MLWKRIVNRKKRQSMALKRTGAGARDPEVEIKSPAVSFLCFFIYIT